MVEAVREERDCRVLKAETIVPTQEHVHSTLDVKWTYEEYLEELKKPIEFPPRDEPDHPGYYKKYAHTVPPIESYYIIPDRQEEVARDEVTKNVRRVYFGWNNITDFERAGMRALQQDIKDRGVDVMPPGFAERDWLKWIQANHYDVAKSGLKLYNHIQWLTSVGPEPRLKNLSLELL